MIEQLNMDIKDKESEQGTSDILRSVRNALDEDQGECKHEDENDFTVVSIIKESDDYRCKVDNDTDLTPCRPLNLATQSQQFGWDDDDWEIEHDPDSPVLKIILPPFDEDQDDDNWNNSNREIGDGENKSQNNSQTNEELETEEVLSKDNRKTGHRVRQNSPSQSTVRVNEQVGRQEKAKEVDASLDLHCYESGTDDLDKEVDSGETLCLPSVSDLNRAIRVTGKVPALDVSPVAPRPCKQSRSRIKIVDLGAKGKTGEHNQPVNQPVSVVVVPAFSTDKKTSSAPSLPVSLLDNKSENSTTDDAGIVAKPILGPMTLTMPVTQSFLKASSMPESSVGSAMSKPPLLKLATSVNSGSPKFSIVQIPQLNASNMPKPPVLTLKPGTSFVPFSKNGSEASSKSTAKTSQQAPIFISKPFKLPTSNNTGAPQVFYVNVNSDGKIVARPNKSEFGSIPSRDTLSDSLSNLNLTTKSGPASTASSQLGPTSTTKLKVAANPLPTPKSVIDVIFSAANNIISSKVSDASSTATTKTNVTFSLPKSAIVATHPSTNANLPKGTKFVMASGSGQPATIFVPNKSAASTNNDVVVSSESQNAIPGTSMPYRTPGSVKVNRHGNIKRPMNAFMVWARGFRPKLSAQMKNATNAEISMRLGQVWNLMPEFEKNQFYAEAERIKLMHKLTYPDWTYKPKVKKQTKPATQTPSPPGLMKSTGTQSEARAIVPGSQSTSVGEVVRQYAFDRSDGAIGTLRGRPPSTMARANDSQTDIGPIVSSYSLVQGWTGQSTEPSSAGPVTVLSETSLATRTLTGINQTLDREPIDLSVGAVIEVSPKTDEELRSLDKKRKASDDEEKNDKKKQKRASSAQKKSTNRRNAPRSRNTRLKKAQSVASTASQTESPKQEPWPFPFSSYPLNEHYTEMAQAANARNLPYVWDNAPIAGQSCSNSSLPDFDPYHPLIFGNSQRLRVQALNMQRWIEYMNTTDDENFAAFRDGFLDGARSDSNTSLASCSKIVENVMTVGEGPDESDPRYDPNKQAAKRRQWKHRNAGQSTHVQRGTPAPQRDSIAQDIMNAMLLQDAPFMPNVQQGGPELSQSLTNLPPMADEIVIEPHNPEEEVAYFGSFADLGFCEIGMGNANNSSNENVPHWPYAQFVKAMRAMNAARNAKLQNAKEKSATNVGGLKSRDAEMQRNEITEVTENVSRKTSEDRTQIPQDKNIDLEKAVGNSPTDDSKVEENSREKKSWTDAANKISEQRDGNELPAAESSTTKHEPKYGHRTRRKSRLLGNGGHKESDSSEDTKKKENVKKRNKAEPVKPGKKVGKRGRKKKNISGVETAQSKEDNSALSQSGAASEIQEDQLLETYSQSHNPRALTNPYYYRLLRNSWKDRYFPPQLSRRSMMPYTSMPFPLRCLFAQSNGQNEALDLSAK